MRFKRTGSLLMWLSKLEGYPLGFFGLREWLDDRPSWAYTPEIPNGLEFFYDVGE
jgi:hypothetical protein